MITDETETEITDETETVMIAIAETTDTMTGMGTTTSTKSHDNRATATAYLQARLTPNVVKATIRSDHTSGRTAMTVTTRAMEIGVNTNRSFVTHSSKATTKVTNVMAGTTDGVTTDDGEMAEFGPGK